MKGTQSLPYIHIAYRRDPLYFGKQESTFIMKYTHVNSHSILSEKYINITFMA